MVTGKLLILFGLGMMIIGIIILLADKLSLGRLPGDIVIRRENFTFAFPLATCIIVSVILTAILWLVFKFKH